MRHYTESQLEAKVNAVNECRRHVGSIFYDVKEAWKPLVGQKVVKVDGTLTKLAKKATPKLPNDAGYGIQSWLNVSGTSVWVVIKSCVKEGKETCTYAKVSFPLAQIENGILVSLAETVDEPDMMVLKDVQTTIRLIENLNSQVDNLKKKLYDLES